MSQVILKSVVRDHVGFTHKAGELLKLTSQPRSQSDFNDRQSVNVLFLSNNERGMVFSDEILVTDD